MSDRNPDFGGSRNYPFQNHCLLTDVAYCKLEVGTWDFEGVFCTQCNIEFREYLDHSKQTPFVLVVLNDVVDNNMVRIEETHTSKRQNCIQFKWSFKRFLFT